MRVSWEQIEDYINGQIKEHTEAIISADIGDERLRGRIAALRDLKAWKTSAENVDRRDNRIGPSSTNPNSFPEYLS